MPIRCRRYPIGLTTALLCVALVAQACKPSSDAGSATGSVAEAPLFPVLDGGLWGYMNKSGDVIVEPSYDTAWPFSEGRALVRRAGLFGYLDRRGSVAIPLQFSDAWYFSNGLAPVLRDTTWSFVDASGRVVESTAFALPPDAGEFDVEFIELDRVRVGDLYGFRNPAGQIVIDPQFEQAWYFVDGLARVRLNGKWGFIDRSGAMVIPARFDVAWDFSDGLARVKVGERYGYIDKSGEYVWEPTM